MKNQDTTFAKIIFVLCILAWMFWPTSTNGQKPLSIEYVKKCVDFDGHMKTSILGILDVTYAIAISEGKTKEQSAEIAAKKLGELLDGLASATSGQMLHPAKMPTEDYFGAIKIDIPDSNIFGLLDIEVDTTNDVGRYTELSVIEPKKDTILVSVLCVDPESKPDYFGRLPGYVVQKRQERTFKWEIVEPFTGKHGLVITSIRWLDPIEGCFGLTPIKQ